MTAQMHEESEEEKKDMSLKAQLMRSTERMIKDGVLDEVGFEETRQS